ncbi:acetylornithine aminotransferase [Tulasnella sp. JGI-2019a]|nr:acetylornithine aminotransferase [Tulasnella sp. JGI-2019a]KAG9002278.1 acetylornithine aminotransferase [Tulasnella sp. JGI-2019a]KAG9032839.1 acetylornithine aminotransferase [Tulasnella sp. JGI-2019a]
MRASRSLPRKPLSLPPSTRFVTRRLNSTKAPCTAYTSVTHPDGALPTASASPKNVLQVYARPPFVLSHGKGSWVYTVPTSDSKTADVEERKYLDFTSGIAVNALGHADPEFAQVMGEQAATLLHTSNVFWNKWAGSLAGLIVEVTKREGGLGLSKDGEDGAKVFFANSGTEANEGAFKFVRKIGKEVWSQKTLGQAWTPPSTDAPNASTTQACPKYRIACFANAFHGRSMGAVSATPNPKYQQPFEPLIPGIDVGELNDVEGLEKLIGEDTCGVIVEPIQGEGGLAVANLEWLRALRKRCDEVGAVLIFDEIQCGLYRTGTLWAHSSYPKDCQPDIVTMAKPLANGYPIGAIMLREKFAPHIAIGSHGTTFGGSPLATRLGHHVLSRLSAPNFVSHVRDAASHLHARLAPLPTLFPTLLLPSVRGRGLLTGLGFKDSADPGILLKMMRERGVLILTAGKDAVRIVPSLIVKTEELDFACDVLESCLIEMQKEKKGTSA